MTWRDRLNQWLNPQPRPGAATASGPGAYANTGVAPPPPFNLLDPRGTIDAAVEYCKTNGLAPYRHERENIVRSTHPDTVARVADAADRLSEGRTVVVPREVANYAENLIIRLLEDDDALHRAGYAGQEFRLAGCRKALSDAIDVADRATRDAGEPR